MSVEPRILIANDERGALDAVAAVLRQAGYHVSRMADAADASAASAASAPSVVVLDVPERSHAELLQGCASRLLEAISTGESLPNLLRIIALGVEEIVPEALVSILLVDEDGEHLRHGAAPSLPRPYLQAIDGARIGPMAGSCGSAVYRREVVIAADVEHHAFWRDYRELARAHGLRACWSTPVVGANGDVLAAFAVYHREPRIPTAEDLHLLHRMAHVVRIAIERDRKDRALYHSQSLLAMASRVSRLGAWSIDLPILTLNWSDEVRAIHEVEPDLTPTVDAAIDFYAPEHRATIRELLEACVRDGTPFDDELRLVTARGRSLWVRAIGEAVHDETGAIVGVQGALQDVTVQRSVEAERLHLATRLNATLESMSDAFCMVDPDWVFVFVNREAERLLQRGRDDLLGRNMWDEFPEARQTVAYDEYQRAILERQARSFELYFTPLERWLEIHAYPSSDGLAIYFRDVTERHQADAALRASEERFRLLSRATNDAIWDWNLIDDTVWWSDRFETLFGFRRDELELTSASWITRIHPDDRPRVIAQIRQVIHGTSDTWADEYRFAQRDGSYAHVRDRGNVIRNADGVAVRMVGGMTDITRQIELEAQLRQAQRLEAIGQLTGGIAHDFNNLLTVILGSADALAEGLPDGSDRHALAEIIVGSAQRAAALTQRLLAFARKQSLDPRAIDVNRLVNGLESLLRRTLGEHIEIALALAPDLDLALVDSAQLENAILNLCVNARDAMPDGGRLTIETMNERLDEAYAAEHAEVQAGAYVLLAISDTGQGIPREHLARVFEPFFTTKEVGQGTGLGLAMVYGFMKQSVGHVAIYSEPGHGTTVRLYLPRNLDGQDERHVSTVTPEVVGGSETILLVEDEASVRLYASTQLAALGYRVIQAENAPRALEIIRERTDIDLLLTDLVMPGGMTGVQLAAAVVHLRPDLRVLYTSGYAEHAIGHQGHLAPGSLLLAKPYRRADLARKVRAALI